MTAAGDSFVCRSTRSPFLTRSTLLLKSAVLTAVCFDEEQSEG